MDSTKDELYNRFWREFAQILLNSRIAFRVPQPKNHLILETREVGKTGLEYVYSFKADGLCVELSDLHNRYFEMLHERAETIEESFGDKLSWERPRADRTNAHVAFYRPGSAIEDETKWADYQAWFSESMTRLREALQPTINALS